MTADRDSIGQWVREVAALTTPDRIHYCDGSEEERERLIAECLASGELIALDQTRLPNPDGAPIDAIVFGARRRTRLPLVVQACDWPHGTFLGATLSSESTAAATGAVGELRRDAMAMSPFCGYNMGDYFAHWLAVGRGLTRPPAVFRVNWFRTGEQGRFIWPGFGDNLRVLRWILDRCDGAGEAVDTPIGLVPAVSAIDRRGLDLPDAEMARLLAVDAADWRDAITAQAVFFSQFGSRLPHAIRDEHARLAGRVYEAISTH